MRPSEVITGIAPAALGLAATARKAARRASRQFPTAARSRRRTPSASRATASPRRSPLTAGSPAASGRWPPSGATAASPLLWDSKISADISAMGHPIWPSTPDCARGRWPAPTRDPATPSRSPATSVPPRRSIARSRPLPRSTATKTSATTPCSSMRSRLGAYELRRSCEVAAPRRGLQGVTLSPSESCFRDRAAACRLSCARAALACFLPFFTAASSCLSVSAILAASSYSAAPSFFSSFQILVFGWVGVGTHVNLPEGAELVMEGGLTGMEVTGRHALRVIGAGERGTSHLGDNRR